ncbi:DUF2314 domain-containing protein [Aquimarina sp. TRL1]|uniref:YegJ family protein n=1 Tax=Aquimarina sp. (strain TRL1) TaxID=2736252 RepID=UPI00158CCC5B|nr:DUF2314 domain-containing protein [Aquimarina sp. TRL1]QKX05851.1 DUF2314 domain-containing protein [Aquimarina sp. TRL1]
MKKILILISVLTLSCNQSKKSKVERENKPDVYNLQETDMEMNNAITKANETFNLFKETFQNDSVNKYYFSIKQKYDTPDGGNEHLWVGQIILNQSDYYGIIGNEPISILKVKLGDTVRIDKKQISDWMIVDNSNGKVKGGYTIRVLRNRMSETERNQFDQNNGLIFEE